MFKQIKIQGVKFRFITLSACMAVICTIFMTCEKPERLVSFLTLSSVDTNISYTTAKLEWEIKDVGAKPIISHGIAIAEDRSMINVTPKSSTETPEKGKFQVQFTGLQKNTTYYYVAFVSISTTPDYGTDVKQFKTKDTEAATVTSVALTDTTLTTVNASAIVTSDGGEQVSKRGFCWGTSANPTLASCLDTTINGSGTGVFTGKIHELTAGTQYYVRAYTINNKGTSYNAADVTFTTYNIPTVTTTALSSQTSTGATSGGNATNSGGSSVTARGVCWSTSTGPTVALPTKTTDSYGTGPFSSTITGLISGTTYYIRAYATNKFGTGYGNEIPFTPPVPPTATTNPATLKGNTTVTLNGNVNANNFSATVTFEYGTTTDYGTTISATPSTVTGNSATGVLANVSGLIPGTFYHFRVKAVNPGGTADGSDLTFTTLKEPVAVTDEPSSVTTISATLNGTVNANNSSTTVTFDYGPTASYGSNIAATPDPVTGNTNTAVSASLTELNPGTTYHYRVKALSEGGTAYGSDKIIGTQSPPVAVIAAASFVSNTAATVNGTVNANNLSTSVSFEYGQTTAYGSSSPATQSPVTGNTSTAVSAGLAGLTPGTLYHFRVAATSVAGTTYSSDLTFITLQPPAATTVAATLAGNTTVTLNGTVNANNSSTTVTFEYGLTAAYGTSVAATPGTVTGNSATSVSANLTGLNLGTTYHFKVKAVSAGGTTDGADLTFITTQPPAVTTGIAEAVTTNTAAVNGTVNANNLSSTVTFEYGLTTSYGLTVTAAESPVSGNSVTPVTAGITGLTPSETYHFRVKAVSSAGTTVGNDNSFATPAMPPAVADFDGNIYSVVNIGTQYWTQSNLKTTHFSSGDIIPNVTDNTEWSALTSGAFAWYNNDAGTYKDVYGALYNWYLTADVRNICPTGWHVPTNNELTLLENYLISNEYNYDGTSIGNKIAKAMASSSSWEYSNYPGSIGNVDYPAKQNASGFTAYPGGYRSYTGPFDVIGYHGYWWSATEDGSTNAWHRGLYNLYTEFRTYSITKQNGFSVRCLKGELPLSETVAASAPASTTVTLNGKVNPNGASTTVSFEYGLTSSYGSEITAPQSPVSGSVPVSINADLTELTTGTIYHYRVKAVNSGGTSYGSDMTFATDPVTITDIDLNNYNVIRIGTQLWMAENLKTTKCNDNSSIPNVVDNAIWGALTSGAYCWYQDGAYGTTYGALYNWFAVNTGKLCPTGWHVPSDAEWTTMEDYLIANGYNYDGTTTDNKIAKALASTTWAYSATPGAVGSTYYPEKRNATGFTALPGGSRYSSGYYYNIGEYGFWWSSTDASYRLMISSYGNVIKNSLGMQYGFSVRCLKD